MRESREELLSDIDATLEKLMQTAEAIKAAKVTSSSDHELELLESTQESLLARLMHRQSIVEMHERKIMLDSIKKEEIQKKVVNFARSSMKRRRNQKLASSRKPRSKS